MRSSKIKHSLNALFVVKIKPFLCALFGGVLLVTLNMLI